MRTKMQMRPAIMQNCLRVGVIDTLEASFLQQHSNVMAETVDTREPLQSGTQKTCGDGGGRGFSTTWFIPNVGFIRSGKGKCSGTLSWEKALNNDGK